VARVASNATTQKLARHEHWSTTARYTKITDTDKRAAVEAMRGPRIDSLETRSPTVASHRAPLRRIK
jgi:hypothetical protein